MSDMLTRLERMEGKIERALTIVETHQAASAQQHGALAEKVGRIERELLGDLDDPSRKGVRQRLDQAEREIGEMRPDVAKIAGHDRIIRIAMVVGGTLGLAVLGEIAHSVWEWWTKPGG